MICVTIARTRHKMALAEYQAAGEQGVGLVELRLDYLRRAPDLNRILNERHCPVIVTIRRPEDGGRYGGSEADRMLVLRSVIAAGVDYVDLEHDTAKLVPRYGKTKRIVSYHNFKTTPQDLKGIHEELQECDPDIIKIVTLAESLEDNVRMLDLVANAEVPTVGFCMGELGTPSRILCLRAGSPFTYASFSNERVVAPGMISFSDMRDLYFCDQINRETEVFGVIGDPVAQSLSPLVHNAAFRASGMNRVYVPFHVRRDELASFLKNAPRLGIKGLSVTIPHKETCLKEVQQADGATQMIGALNTIVLRENGMEGYNTDYRAAMDSIEVSMGGGTGETSPLLSKHAMLLGAGGAARAIAHGLVRRGAIVSITNRNEERGERLAKETGARFVKWGQRMTTICDILVNCTPLGMYPEVNETPIPGNSLREGMLVFDTIYHPENTILIKEAKARGCRVVTGVDMFIRQAELQFQIFTGIDAPTDLMSNRMRQRLSAAGN